MEVFMARKLLFLLFNENKCIQNHAFSYAIDLKKNDHDVQIVLEGPALQCLKRLLNERDSFSKLFNEAKKLNLISGVCKMASSGCSNDENSVAEIAKKEELTFLDDLNGHAGIGSFINNGYEIIVF